MSRDYSSLRYQTRGKNSGVALLIIAILIFVGILIGVWGLSSSHWAMMRSGSYRGRIAVQYQAEEAFQKAVLRIQEISNPLETDSLFTKGLYGGTEKNIDFLVDPMSICLPGSNCNAVDPECPKTFFSKIGLDEPLSDASGNKTNVICNFMGTALKDTQVILVRKADHNAGTRSAVFLLSALSSDSAGRKKIVQGVAILPYSVDPPNCLPGAGCTYSLPPGEKAYVATTTEVAVE